MVASVTKARPPQPAVATRDASMKRRPRGGVHAHPRAYSSRHAMMSRGTRLAHVVPALASVALSMMAMRCASAARPPDPAGMHTPHT